MPAPKAYVMDSETAQQMHRVRQWALPQLGDGLGASRRRLEGGAGGITEASFHGYSTDGRKILVRYFDAAGEPTGDPFEVPVLSYGATAAEQGNIDLRNGLAMPPLFVGMRVGLDSWNGQLTCVRPEFIKKGC